MVVGDGAILMEAITVVGGGAGTSGTAATSPMLGDVELRESAGMEV